MIIKDN